MNGDLFHDQLVKSEVTSHYSEEVPACWKEIEQLSRQIRLADEELQEFIMVSATYGRIKYQIFEKSWKIMLLGKQGEYSGNLKTETLQSLIAEYDALWEEWRQLEVQHPRVCATLYKDHYCQYIHHKKMIPVPGIGATINAYRNI